MTGVLASRSTAIDLRIDQFSMQVNGQELVRDCTLELNAGRRYGLLGANGCGKSNLLAALAGREVPVPAHLDVYHLREEAEPSQRTALQAVVDHIEREVNRLQALEASILAEGGVGDEAPAGVRKAGGVGSSDVREPRRRAFARARFWTAR